MKIGIISDTHGNLASIRQAVAAAGSVEMWLHAGDYCTDGNSLSEFTGLPVIAAAGNCDGRNAPAKMDEFIEVAGKKIWLTHGHRYGVKYGITELIYWGKQFEADVIIYGHTHIPDISWQDNILIVNPGSAGEPRNRLIGTCGLLELSEDVKSKVEIREFNPL